MSSHEFKPYADMPDYCVAELDSGDTCNLTKWDHRRYDIMKFVKSVLDDVDAENPDAGYYDYFEALHEQTDPRYA